MAREHERYDARPHAVHRLAVLRAVGLHAVPADRVVSAAARRLLIWCATMTVSFSRQFDFSGKTVCVTGAASGIGRATALLFGELGARVHLADRTAEPIEQLALERPGVFQAVPFEQSDRASI